MWEGKIDETRQVKCRKLSILGDGYMGILYTLIPLCDFEKSVKILIYKPWLLLTVTT